MLKVIILSGMIVSIMQEGFIAGSGGGGEVKVEVAIHQLFAKDNLHSKQFATLLDLISEGEIEGFSSPSKEGRTKGTTAYKNAAKKDIFLDNTPILSSNADSTNPSDVEFNQKNVDLDIRFGTDSQTKMSKFREVLLFGVGVNVENGSPMLYKTTY